MQNTMMETPRQHRRRPLGVTIMAVLLGIQALLELIIGAVAVVAITSISRTIRVHGHTVTSNVVDFFGWALGSIPLIIGVITLILALGLWFLKRWAFWTTVVIMVIFLLRQVIEFIRPHDSIVAIVLGAIIPIVVLLYLFVDPRVRAAFGIFGT